MVALGCHRLTWSIEAMSRHKGLEAHAVTAAPRMPRLHRVAASHALVVSIVSHVFVI